MERDLLVISLSIRALHRSTSEAVPRRDAELYSSTALQRGRALYISSSTALTFYILTPSLTGLSQAFLITKERNHDDTHQSTRIGCLHELAHTHTHTRARARQMDVSQGTISRGSKLSRLKPQASRGPPPTADLCFVLLLLPTRTVAACVLYRLPTSSSCSIFFQCCVRACNGKKTLRARGLYGSQLFSHINK